MLNNTINQTDGQLQTLRRTALIIIGVALALKLFYVFTAPVHHDTNYYLNIASNFMQRGRLTHHMWRVEDTSMLTGGGAGYGVLVQVGWFALFGLSAVSGQLFSYVASILALVALFYMARAWQGARTAWFAIAFGAVSSAFFVNFSARMDSVATLVYIGVLSLHLYAVSYSSRSSDTRGHLILHFLVGTASIAAAEFHILALLYVCGLSVYYLAEIFRAHRVTGTSIAFFSGALLVGLGYLAIHVLPNVQQYLIAPTQCPFCLPLGPGREAARIIEFGVHFPVEMILLGLALWAAARRGTDGSRHYLLLQGGALAGLIIFAPSPQTEYTGHLWPLFAIGTGLLLADGTRRNSFFTRNAMLIQFFIAVTLIALHIVRAPFVPVKEIPAVNLVYLQEHIPKTTVVMGSVRTYYQLLDYPEFMTYRDDERYGLILRGEDYPAYWARQKPLVFIGDPANDEQLRVYLAAQDFAQVLPDLWVASILRK